MINFIMLAAGTMRPLIYTAMVATGAYAVADVTTRLISHYFFNKNPDQVARNDSSDNLHLADMGADSIDGTHSVNTPDRLPRGGIRN